jgi:hypothetical protein
MTAVSAFVFTRIDPTVPLVDEPAPATGPPVAAAG